jgi:hypothetical protein
MSDKLDPDNPDKDGTLDHKGLHGRAEGQGMSGRWGRRG